MTLSAKNAPLLTSVPISMAPTYPPLRPGTRGPLMNVTSLTADELDDLLNQIVTGTGDHAGLPGVSGGVMGPYPCSNLKEVAQLLSRPSNPAQATRRLRESIQEIPSPLSRLPQLGTLTALLCGSAFPDDEGSLIGLHLNQASSFEAARPAILIFSGCTRQHRSLRLTWLENGGALTGECLHFPDLDTQLDWHVAQLPPSWNRAGIRASMARVAAGTLNLAPLLAPPVTLR